MRPSILRLVDDQPVSPLLEPYLLAVYGEVQRVQPQLANLYDSLRGLLIFLSSPRGRTHANCVATDSFFMLPAEWERDWAHLPESVQDFLGDLGGALHDTISAPEIAENFAATPEAMLARLSQVEIDAPPV